jgi:hypothetical protein
MRQVATALMAMTCLLFFSVSSALAQVSPPSSVGFNNKSEININVIGYTIVNGQKRGGPVLQLKKTGGKAFESSVPAGFRVYTILDANNGRILGTQQVPINRDVIFDIVPAQGNPNRLMIVPAATTPMQ